MKEDLLLTKADKLLELGKLQEAKEEYLNNNQKTHAAFVAILDQNIPEALELYLSAPHSAAKKWGLFLCDFFTNPKRAIPSPGVLAFRLYFETTFSYCHEFGLTDYVKKFSDYANALVMLYPEYISDMEKVGRKVPLDLPDALS